LKVAVGSALLLLAPGTAPLAGAQSDAVRLIVHDSNPVASITRAQASRLFLKKVTVWENGSPVLPVDQADTATVREVFSNQVHGKSLGEVKAYWQRMIFSGRSLPPPIKGSDREVIEFVRANPGAIG
jgi:ABC-type phosphate transport system substrate-binding protein